MSLEIAPHRIPTKSATAPHHAGKARVLSYSAPNICGVVIT
jgi:hypothetical protein